MKSYIKYCVGALIIIFFTDLDMNAQTLVKKGNFMGRAYHDGLSCTDCHDAGVKNFPSDFACISCHDMEALVEATTRPEEDKWQNPHNNLHYGKDVPCMECHGEHKEMKPLCQGCHNFKYPNYKP